MKENGETMVLASFVADSLALGAHLGEESLTGQWVTGLKRQREILDLLDRIA